MGLSGLFSIGLSGLAAQTASLEAVSNNIANSQTVGFRRARTDFAQLVAHEQAATNTGPGAGVNATNRLLANEQGFINRTQNSTDIAVSGNGFFVVSENTGAIGADNPSLFTRAGDFRIDDNGNLVNSAGYFLRGQAIGANGAGTIGGLGGLQVINLANIEGSATATTQSSLSAVFSSLADISTAAASYNANDPANNLTSGNVASDLRQTFTIFDNEGNSTSLTLAFIRTGTNQIAVEAFDANATDNLPIASGVLNFTSSGTLDAATSTFPASINPGGNFSPLAIDLSGVTIGTGTTRIISTGINGAGFGTVTGFDIGSDGILSATLSNGERQDLFQIPLALFTNAEGLESVAATAFQFDPSAGALTLSAAGTERAGLVESTALETSTVDIGVEFSTLIETQRAYAANARIITVADDLLQTLNGTAV